MPPSAAPEAALLAAPARTLTVPGIRRRPVPHAVPPLVGEPGAVTSVFHHLSPDQGVLDLVLTDDGRRVPTAPTAPTAPGEKPSLGGSTMATGPGMAGADPRRATRRCLAAA